jgi:hypothetical protein
VAEIPVTESSVHQALNALNRIEAEHDRATKIEILASLKDNDVARWMFSVDCPSNRRLGIRVSEETSRIYVGTAKAPEMEDRFERLKSIVSQVLSNELSKQNAKDAIELLLHECSHTNNFREGVWYTRLINHGMRLGLPMRAVAEVWPELRLTSTMPFARSVVDHNGSLSERKLRQIGYPCVAEPIVGGVIASAVLTKTDPHITAFGGRRLPACQGWADALRRAISEDAPAVIVNGEFVVANVEGGTVRKGRKEKAAQLCRVGMVEKSGLVDAESELTFIIYDIYPVTSLASGVFKLEYGHTRAGKFCRSSLLASIATKMQEIAPQLKTEVIDQTVCRDEDALVEAHQKHMVQGYSGSIIKPCHSILRFEPSDCLYKWKEVRKQVGYILSVYRMREAVCVEVFVHETNCTQHLHIPTDKLQEWFADHMESLTGYAVEFTETPVCTETNQKWRLLSRLLPKREPLSLVQMTALGEKFGVGVNPSKKRMPISMFTEASCALGVDEE